MFATSLTSHERRLRGTNPCEPQNGLIEYEVLISLKNQNQSKLVATYLFCIIQICGLICEKNTLFFFPEHRIKKGSFSCQTRAREHFVLLCMYMIIVRDQKLTKKK